MDSNLTDLSAFDFDLPGEQIALRPVHPRDTARLLVVHADGRFEDAYVRDLPTFFSPGDVMVFNDTRVLPAALSGIRLARNCQGHDISMHVNLAERLSAERWHAFVRPEKRLKIGDRIIFGDDFFALVKARLQDGGVILGFNRRADALDTALEAFGSMPLPPYIQRHRPADKLDREHYQTRFATGNAHSVAAPTAGLHFTPRLLKALDVTGIRREMIRLHVGAGTFAPLRSTQIESGKLHAEWRQVSRQTAERLNMARAGGQRCIAVGTTVLRALESAASTDGLVRAERGPTDIFLRPGYRFKTADALMTNFHLPRSSLFMLVSAFMGTRLMQAAYVHAIKARYRFYSYGDACLLLGVAAKRPPCRA